MAGSCPDVRRLEKMALGVLDPAQSAEIRAHLAVCDSCSHTLDALKAGNTLSDRANAPENASVKAAFFPQSTQESDGDDDEEIDEAIRRQFELDWRQAKAGAIDGYLPPETDSTYPGTLEELVHIDLEFRHKAWSSGESTEPPTEVQVYLQRFPALNRREIARRLEEQQTRLRVRYPRAKTEDTTADDDDIAPGRVMPRRLGPYVLGDILGVGGMGMVYQARDEKLERTVAVKVMKPDFAARKDSRRRFLREARLAAKISHERIVPVLTADEHAGIPYLAMPLLHGETLERRLSRDRTLPVPEAIRIAREIAEGLAVAHASGMVHRDIKPANIWLDSDDALASPAPPKAAAGDESTTSWIHEPAAPARGRVKLMDFGLARPMEADVNLTFSGVLVGTPAYMAPEQARGEDVDGRADLFGLGVILYRMCTGKLPFAAKDAMSTLMSIAIDVPAAPRKFNSDLPPALSDFILRLLAKQPDQRPASAREVVAALEQIERLPASPLPSPKPAARRRGPSWRATIAVSLAACLVLAAAAITVIRIQTPHGQFKVEVQDKDVAIALDQSGGLLVEDQKTGRKYRVTANVAKSLPTGEYEIMIQDQQLGLEFSATSFALKEPNSQAAIRVSFAGKPPDGTADAKKPGLYDALSRKDISPYELSVAGGGDPAKAAPELVAVFGDSRLQTAAESHVGPRCVAFSRDGSLIAATSDEPTLRLFDAATGEQRRTIALGNEPQFLHSVLAHPDGKTLFYVDRSIRTFDIATGAEKDAPFAHPDAQTIRTGDAAAITQSRDGKIRVWKLADNSLIGQIDADAPHDTRNTCAISRDGSVVAYFKDKTPRIWSTAEKKDIESFEEMKGDRLTLSPDGRLLAVASFLHPKLDHHLQTYIWDRQEKTVRHKVARVGYVFYLDFSPDGRYLITGGHVNPMQVWNAATGEKHASITGNRDDQYGPVFSPDGKRIASVGGDARVRLWRLDGREDFAIPFPTFFTGLLVTPTEIGTRSYDGLTRLWPVRGGANREFIARSDAAPVLQRDGKRLATFTRKPPAAAIVNTQTGASAITIALKGVEKRGGLALSPDEQWLAVTNDVKGQVKLVHLPTMKERLLDGLPGWLGFADNATLVARQRDKVIVRKIDAEKNEREFPLEAQVSTGKEETALSGDGRTLAVTTGFYNYKAVSAVTLYELATGKKTKEFPFGRFLALSHDGSLLATATLNKVSLWNVATADLVKSIDTGAGQHAIGLAFTPDERHLAVANANGTVYVLRLRN